MCPSMGLKKKFEKTHILNFSRFLTLFDLVQVITGSQTQNPYFFLPCRTFNSTPNEQKKIFFTESNKKKFFFDKFIV